MVAKLIFPPVQFLFFGNFNRSIIFFHHPRTEQLPGVKSIFFLEAGSEELACRSFAAKVWDLAFQDRVHDGEHALRLPPNVCFSASQYHGKVLRALFLRPIFYPRMLYRMQQMIPNINKYVLRLFAPNPLF